MKFNKTYLLYGGALLIACFLAYASYSSKDNKEVIRTDVQKETRVTAVEEVQPADKIEVFLFHNTQRCVSCVNIGDYAKKAIAENFPDEYAAGKIEFKEVNVDLPENKEVAKKFQAAGSALFINAIIAGEDNIAEDTKVWRLAFNEQAFNDYLVEKLKQLL